MAKNTFSFILHAVWCDVMAPPLVLNQAQEEKKNTRTKSASYAYFWDIYGYWR